MKKQTILIILIISVVGILISVPLFTYAQSNNAQSKQYDVFVVLWRGITDAEKGFMDYLSQRNIGANFIIRDCGKDVTRVPGIMKEIRDTKPDLVYIFGTTLTTKIAGTITDGNPDQFITDIPIIFNIVADPIGASLVPNLVTSGRNLTGVSHMVPVPAQVRAMKSVAEFTRLGVIFNPQEKNSVLCVKALEDAADSHNFQVIRSPIPLDENRKPIEDISPDIVKIFVSEGVDLVYLPSDSFIISHSKYLVNIINESGIPTFSATEGPILNADALMGLVSRYYNVGQFAGYKAEQILVSRKHPKNIPIETLKRFSFIINMKTARKMGFYPPIAILKFAEVITG